MSVDDGFERIGEDPFALPVSRRDPIRRLRGRMPAPVTVWTARGAAGLPAGLTVSSVMVVEGEPPGIIGLVGPLTEWWEAVQVSRRFVVHVVAAGQARLADQFAGRHPVRTFEDVETVDSEWGPVLVAAPTRAYCTLAASSDAGYFLLVHGTVDSQEIGEETPPLVHYRGRYVTTEAPRR